MDGLLQAHRLRDADQLPHRRRAPALPARLPGRDLHGRRPDLPRALGHGRRLGDQGQRPGRAERLRPRRRRRALHHQRRRRPTTRTARYGTLSWTPELDVADPRAAAAAAASSSRTPRPTCRPRSRRTSRSRSTWRSRPTTRRTRSRTSATRRADFEVDAVRDVLRRPADRAGQRQARARRGRRCTSASTAARSTPAADQRVAGRRALRRGRRRLLPPRPRRRAGHQARATRSRCGSRRGGKRSQSFTYTQARRRPAHRCCCWPPRTTSGKQPGPAPADRAALPAYYEQALHAQRHRLRRLRHRRARPHRAGPARRAQPLQRGRLVHGRRLRPARAGPAAAAPARRSWPTTRTGGRARLPQRGRQAVLHGEERRRWDLAGRSRYNPQGSRRTATPAAERRRSNCVPLSNDFLQYWLGAYVHIDAARTPKAALRRRRGRAVRADGGPDGAAQRRRTRPTTRTTRLVAHADVAAMLR